MYMPKILYKEKKLEIIIYGAIFIIGTLLGSFFTLAIYRIPLKQDITHERSYCPKCNHRLEFLDLIPILSYIFLGAKCRYCKEKIRPRYLLLETFSGLLFLLFAISLKIDIFNIEINKIAYLIFGIFYISTLFIIGGIEKETHSISKSVLAFGVITEVIYIIYLYIVKISIYKYVIYLLLMLAFMAISTRINKKEKPNYAVEILALCAYLVIGTNELTAIISAIATLLLVAIQVMITKIKYSKKETVKKKENKNIPMGFYLCFTNIVMLIIYNLLN